VGIYYFTAVDKQVSVVVAQEDKKIVPVETRLRQELPPAYKQFNSFKTLKKNMSWRCALFAGKGHSV
jgi:hypothetical protein